MFDGGHEIGHKDLPTRASARSLALQKRKPSGVGSSLCLSGYERQKQCPAAMQECPALDGLQPVVTVQLMPRC